MTRTLILLATVSSALPGRAADMGDYIGWTIAAKKTISGYVDEEGEQQTSFKGCKHGRKILFTDQTYLTCTGYGYQYAYRPDAYLLVRNGAWVMLVEHDAYDMRN